MKGFSLHMKRYLLLYIVFLACGSYSHAQDKAYAKSVVDTLTSPFFAGRGYVQDGDWKAALYIMNAFQQANLRKLLNQDDFQQKFSMTVNTFPGKMLVKVDGKELQPGADYIVDPLSGGCALNTYIIEYADSAFLARLGKKRFKKPKHKFAIAVEEKYLEKAFQNGLFQKINALGPSAIIEVESGRLIWSVSNKAIDIPFIHIKKEKLPKTSATITLEIEEQLNDHITQNMLGYVPGSVYPDSFIFITAHYDHLGMMGDKTYFPGANDNASGTAMMLDLARYYAEPVHQPRYSVVFVAFAGEEAGLVGSHYYTQHPIIPLNKISFLINLDLMANGESGTTVVNGGIYTGLFKKLKAINDDHKYLPEVNARGKAANSDHYWFSENGVKAFFLYLLGTYPYYHDIYDTPNRPSFAGYDGAFRLIRDFVNTFGQDSKKE
jgi:hypothetical protein